MLTKVNVQEVLCSFVIYDTWGILYSGITHREDYLRASSVLDGWKWYCINFHSLWFRFDSNTFHKLIAIVNRLTDFITDAAYWNNWIGVYYVISVLPIAQLGFTSLVYFHRKYDENLFRCHPNNALSIVVKLCSSAPEKWVNQSRNLLVKNEIRAQ